MTRRLLIGVTMLALFVVFAISYRVELMLIGIKLMASQQYSISENVPVSWKKGPTVASHDQPNIVLIVADDLGWNDISLYGGGIADGTVPTPHINSIAAQGVSFTNGYAGQGTCAPSRAMMMTGRYGARFGFEYTPTPPNMLKMLSQLRSGEEPALIEHFDSAREVAYDEMGLPASEITVAEMLKEQGYYTAHIGKWHLGRSNGSAPHEQGFDDSLLMASGLYDTEDSSEVINSKLDYDPIDKFLWAAMRFAASFNGGEAFEPDGYLTDYYTSEAVKVIENNKNRPFFLYLAHWAPHTPLQAKRDDFEALSHIKDHTTRVYASMIRALDRGVGEVLTALKRHGLEENTVVIFTSDNGGAGYVGIDDLNRPFRGWKITNFEGGIHVPYLVKWPRNLTGGQTYDKPVHHFDIFALAAAASGASLPSDRKVDGVNILKYVNGDVSERPHETLFWRAGNYHTVRHKDWKLAEDRTQGKVWLFDLATDPGERVNVAEQFPEIRTELGILLEKHQMDMVPPLWDLQLESPVFLDKHLRQNIEPDDEFIYWGN